MYRLRVLVAVRTQKDRECERARVRLRRVVVVVVDFFFTTSQQRRSGGFDATTLFNFSNISYVLGVEQDTCKSDSL